MSRMVDRLEAPMSSRAAVAWWASAMAMVVLGVVALVLTSLWRAPVADRLGAAEELQRDAGTIVAQVFSASSDTWKADRERARGLVTGGLAASVSDGLSADPPPGVRSVRWEPVQIGVVEAERDSGTALIVVNVVVTPSQGEVRAQTKSVNAFFLQIDGQWKLDGLDELQ